MRASRPEITEKPTLAKTHLVFRHALLCLAFIALSVVLSQPEVIFVSRLGWSAWYPATGLVLALLLGVSPWYAVLVCFTDALVGVLLYHQSIWSYGETIGSIRVAVWY